MFYRKEDVDEAIICGICNNVLNNPRLLPCSESACHECIQFIIKTDPNQEFACKFCKRKHTPGKDGFPLNGTLMKLLKAKAGSVYRNEKVDELKEKLVEIKSKCEKFQLSLENGVDQVRKHCIQLRNQVDLETEKLINEAHKFNDSLIAEINTYEEECVKCFKRKVNKKDDKYYKFIHELNSFHSDKTMYLTEFKIDEKVVEETITKADGHLEKLKIEDASLKNTLFNGKEVEFRKSPNKIERTLLGTLVYKSLSLDLTRLNELKFSNNHITSYLSSLHLFKNHDENNFAFYIDKNNSLCMTKFHNDGNVMKQVINALKFNDFYLQNGEEFPVYQLAANRRHGINRIYQLKVTQSLNNFIIFVRLQGHVHAAINGRQIYDNQAIVGLFFILDQDFNYITHNSSFRNQQLLHMTANTSRVLWIDSSYNVYLLDMNLTLINDNPLEKIKNQIDPYYPSCPPGFTNVLHVLNTSTRQIPIVETVSAPHLTHHPHAEKLKSQIVDIQMNEKYVFVLCHNNLTNQRIVSANTSKMKSSGQLKIFEINSGNLVNKVDTSANQIKLAPDNRLVLFDSFDRIVYLYEQTEFEGEFCKLEEINFAQSLETDLEINRDQSNCLTFGNSKYMKYTSLN